ncbi:Dynein regulatory complex protein 11 [Eumeta japonica]|uniref:Dynein regulatory complex protein 11 n=1 Tax=Eumeta variegata TaxID=151549 RepID=A0A4C1SA25_EUMVA|nr:Dynein regulatory complex protein 11 [Eumeta japonica]
MIGRRCNRCFRVEGSLYSALSEMDSVYDQLLQSQKRLLIKDCWSRVLEGCWRSSMVVEFHLSDFTYDDDEISVTPEEAEPRIPHILLEKELKKLKKKNRFIAEILKRLGHEPPKIQPLILTEQQAVLIIQAHERARGRLRGQFMKEIRLLKEKGRGEKGEMSAAAATAIQRVWRGFIARRETKEESGETLLIGMELPPYAESKTMKRAEEVKEYRRGLQTKREQEYLETLESIEDSVRKKHAPRLHDQMADELRRRVNEYFERTGKFPDFHQKKAVVRVQCSVGKVHFRKISLYVY